MKNYILFTTTKENLDNEIISLRSSGAQLLTVFANDERSVNNNFKIYAIFLMKNGDIVELSFFVNSDELCYESISRYFPSANWLEREIFDTFGIKPIKHPDLRPIINFPDWPKDTFSMRKDFINKKINPGKAKDFNFIPVKGEGIFQVPVGPIHAGIIEPGHFRFFVFGEDMINMQAQLFFTHRGIEKLIEGSSVNDALLYIERLCGVSSASHAYAFSKAIESIYGLNTSKYIEFFRAIILELERLYNHIGDIGNICAGVGFHFAVSRGSILKEKLQQLNFKYFGHRYLRGIICPGGLKRGINFDSSMFIELDHIESELKNLFESIKDYELLLDRFVTTGILHKDVAIEMGATGVALRASGVNFDTRKDIGYSIYPDLEFNIPFQIEGDVYCRFVQRFEECIESFKIIKQCFEFIKKLDDKVFFTDLPEIIKNNIGIGVVETPRGTALHWVMLDESEKIYRIHIRSASHRNWMVLPFCIPKNIIPDFPLINKSFELCYSSMDR
jgi:Ni,Fe-hydrogenase III large subunit/Ni,Fe-hydrogenase III component G